MDTGPLLVTVRSLLEGDKGLLAMDESTPTCDRRFAAVGIAQTEPMRRAYRELIVTTPGLGRFVSGAILYDETVHQRTRDGVPMVEKLVQAGIVPGIKVDAGTQPLAGRPGEKVTEGLDGLRGRLLAYRDAGLRFAKWRGVIAIGDDRPSDACVNVNAHALARYAALCQEAGMVPIVEPEVVMDGDHSLDRCSAVTGQVLQDVFGQLRRQGVALEGLLLKPNMVLPGDSSPQRPSADEVADATVTCLLRNVPAAVPGVAFLSGGQSPELASARLNAMNARFRARLPWTLTYSFSRAIQQPALELWRGDAAHVADAQQALVRRAELNHLARRGEYSSAMETA